MFNFTSSVTNFQKYLRYAGLRFDYQSSPAPVPATLRALSYYEQWKEQVNQNWYSYKLEDHSLLLFMDGVSPSYSYVECPLPAQNLPDFAKSKGLTGAEIYTSEIREEYELYLGTLSIKEHVTPIRFDYDEKGFDDRCHPLCHLHIGLHNQLRIATSRVWSPTAFGLFVIRQHYPESWRRLLTSNLGGTLEKKVRSGLLKVSEKHFSNIEKREVFLG